MHDADLSNSLADTVRAAAAARTALAIRGGQTKQFHTGTCHGTPLDVRPHRGIVSYEPTELVITARAGTPLAEIDAALAAYQQMLGFEPPHFGKAATLGGTIACGFSGPRRPYAGSARDFVLGTRIINGRGEILKFGGQVMKNVAGYDLSRLMAGSFGTLAVLLEVSLKVLPRPATEMTLGFQTGAADAIGRMNTWAGLPLPLSAAAHSGDTLYIRLSGAESAVRAAHTRLGGEPVANGDAFWHDLREHQQPFFHGSVPLWRLSLPPAAPMPALAGAWLIDWGGAQRWLKSDTPAAEIHRQASAAGGYATLFRGPRETPGRETPLAEPLRRLQENLKQSLDPAGIFNVA